MNKITHFLCLFLLIFLALHTAKSQTQTIPNADFEEFVNNMPQKWFIPNFSGLSCNVDSTHDAYHGKSAVRLTTTPVPLTTMAFPSILTLGDFDLTAAYPQIRDNNRDPYSMAKYFSKGFPIDKRPGKITGYYKANTTKFVVFAFTKKNGAYLDEAKFETVPQVSNEYLPFELIFWNTTDIPDELHILFMAGDTIGSQLLIDSLSIYDKYEPILDKISIQPKLINGNNSGKLDSLDCSPEQRIYKYTVDYNIEIVELNGILRDISQTNLSITGNQQSLVVGENKFVFIVADIKDTRNTFNDTLIIKRLAENAEKSSDATLKSIRLKTYNGNSISFSPAFNPNMLSYLAEIEHTATEIYVSAESNNEYVKTNGVGKFELPLNSNNIELTIHVVAEDGQSSKTYKIQLNREPGNNANLKSLKIFDSKNNFSFSPAFHPDTVDYQLEVENEISIVTLEVEKSATKATVTGNDIYLLKEGTNKCAVNVIGTNGSTSKQYTVSITRKALSAKQASKEVFTICIFPNPTTDIVKFTGISGYAKVDIYDLLGNFVGQEDCNAKSEISFSKFNRGIYLLKIYANGKMYTKKLILK